MQDTHETHPPVMLFLSYAQEDEALRAQLEKHLRLLQRQGLISTWHDRLILAGSNQAQEIENQLNMASIILLLISADFLASDYCYGVEMQRALERAERNEAYVIPILLRPVDLRDAPFRDLPSLPRKNKPVTLWPNQDEAFREIAAGIRAAAKQIRNAADRNHLPPLSLHTITVIPDQPEITLEEAEMAYREQVVETYKRLNFSGFDRPDLSLANVRLEDVFVRLALTVEKVIREPVPSEKSSQAGRRESQQRERVITVQEPIELSQALNNHLLIVGEPGAGKSTLLRWLAVTFAQMRQREPDRVGPSADRDRLPILVELGQLPDRYLKPESREMPNWLQFLPRYLCEQLAFTDTSPQLLTQALTEGRCLLLFDGLDEVANREVRARLARSLAELALHSPSNRVIIGSRPVGVSGSEGTLHPLFQHCQIQRFTPEEVQTFFRFWYALDHSLSPEQQEKAADALMARVRAIPAILQLASTPLLSTILVLIWRNKGDLPERRVELYEHCCRVLIELWETSHDIAYRGVLTNMDWEDHLRLLAPLAYSIHSQEQRTSATREELLPLLAQAIQIAGYSSELAAATREAKSFLDALGLRSGLLQFMGDNRYGFPHLTFQEYLAARHIAAQPECINLVMPRLHEAWWQQVHLLTIAHLGSSPTGFKKASSLILTILQVYPQPMWILRSSQNPWLRLIGPGRYLPWVQPERRIAWILAREFELAARGYLECLPNETEAKIGMVLSAQAVSLVRHLLSDWARREEQEDLLDLACQLSQCRGGEAVMEALAVTLHDADSLGREQVAKSLGKLGAGNEEVVKALQTALYDVDARVGMQAAASLRKLGVGNGEIVEDLLAVLHNDADEWVRRQADERLDKLREINEKVIRDVVVDLYKVDVRVREWAAASLGWLGVDTKEVMKALLVALHHRFKWVRSQAAESLGKLGAGNEEVLKALIAAALHDEEEDVRSQVAASLAELGAGNEKVLKALLAVLRDEGKYARRQAAASLGKLGVGNEKVVSALLVALYDEEEDVRRQVAVSLGKLGVVNEEVVRVLLAALRDEEGDVRRQAAADMGKLRVGNEEVVRALLTALHDTDVRVRSQAAASLRGSGMGSEGVKALIVALHNADKDVRSQAAASLGMLGVGNEEVVSALLVALYDEEEDVRRQAAASLGKLGVVNEEVVRVLLAALRDEEEGVRAQAAADMGKLGAGNEEVVSALLTALHDADVRVRSQAAASLGELGVGNEVVVKVLVAALHDKEWDVRVQASASLGSLEIKDTTQLRRALIALNCRFYEGDDLRSGDRVASDYARRIALASIRQLLDGRPIPGYQWMSIRKRRLKRTAF